MKIEHITVDQVYYFKVHFQKKSASSAARAAKFTFFKSQGPYSKNDYFFEKLQIPSLYFKKLSAERKFEIKMVKKCLGPKMGKMVFDLDK